MRPGAAVQDVSRLVALALCAALAPEAAMPGLAKEAGAHETVDRLAYEKTLAEGCVSILKSFGAAHPMIRVQGERLYARARADVDGLIALLGADLMDGHPRTGSPELRHRLEAVPRQRQAVCRHVQAAVGASVDEGGTDGSIDLLERGSADAGGSLVESWQAYRVGTVRREELEAARWLPYAEVP